MKILESFHNRFILLGICPSNSDNPFIKFRNVALSATLFTMNICSATASLIFVFRNSSTNLEGSLHGAMSATATLAVLYMTVMAFILRHDIDNTFLAFQDIYDKCMCLNYLLPFKNYHLVSDENVFYSNLLDKDIDFEQSMQKANKQSAWMTKFGDYYTVLYLITATIMLLASFIYNYISMGYVSADNLFHIFSIALVDSWLNRL